MSESITANHFPTLLFTILNVKIHFSKFVKANSEMGNALIHPVAPYLPRVPKHAGGHKDVALKSSKLT